MLKIGPFEIGNGRSFIIAEAGINHNGDISLAKELVQAAYEAGADAIKFQSFRAESICDPTVMETKDIEGITKGSKSAFDMYKALELSNDQHIEIFEYAKKVGILCFTSVFDLQMIDFLSSLNTPVLKISSGDLTYLPLIEKACESKSLLIISTGLATFSEILKVHELLVQKKHPYVLLHCVSEYPLKPENANLRVIPFIKKVFQCSVGFSDHSAGTLLSEAAVGLGAEVIEKHFTIDNNLTGPDHPLSLNPNDFSLMVKNIRSIEKALGTPYKSPTPNEWEGRYNGRRGIKALKELKKGNILNMEDLMIIKPESGLKPKHLKSILGKKIKEDVKKGTPIEWKFFE